MSSQPTRRQKRPAKNKPQGQVPRKTGASRRERARIQAARAARAALPELSALTADVDRFLNQWVRDRVRDADPILQVGHTLQHEGTRRYMQDPDGHRRYSNYRETRSEFALPRDTYRNMDVPQLMVALEQTIRDQAAQMARAAYEELHQITAATGNVVNAQGAPYTFELDFRLLERIEFDFEDNDPFKPILPTPIMPPEMAAIRPQRQREWFANPANEHRFKEMLKAKYANWRAREDRRTLAD